MTEVLIAGAGPTGLVAAIELARRGVAVRVIDKSPQPFHGSRGKGLQPRTLEVFDDLGVVEEVLALGGPYLPIRVYAGRVPVWRARIGKITAPTAQTPYPNLLMIPQNHTERVLRDRLTGLGVEVEFGVALTDFTQDAEGVTARLGDETTRVRYLVGADGAHSVVRKRLGIPFEGQTREAERMIVADVRLSGVDRDVWRAYVKPLRRRFMLAMAPLPGTELFQLIAPLRPGETPELTREAIQRRLADAGARSARVAEVAWSSVWRANIRMARRYRDGRALIAGDAAHVHSPAGGQGLNTGVQDAYNLGWKLAAVLAGADEELLETYEAERLPVAAVVLGLSTRLHDTAATSVTKAFKRGADTDQLGIHYRYSPLSVGERAGDRAADGVVTSVDGERLRLFDLYRGPHWTLLAAAEPPAELDPGVRVHRVRASPTGDAFTLVRPDGYIGLTCRDARQVSEYLRRITVPTRPAIRESAAGRSTE
ncbi:FAD-dependent monooxygenase [Stackebrandtia nassauensis]|uniref:Monooxygenase FAD-binding protein n=1 Tax=Stackebrandtia nassauensis (strain DSM 44728 / CIP 108903 / NRRL B-16338 / NBRC 102104 / LLR-40K-21) TaxID=446470 RepID=D3PXB3_STANL|nr:FAD-dependent monooxygenase [Stackebrandtia nassauensis]ADD41376.1 monooxygenase FAD-binding protein [Stackebrandtia nassauensis DSM 44728]